MRMESGTGGQGTDPTMKTTSQMRQSQLVKTFGDVAVEKLAMPTERDILEQLSF